MERLARLRITTSYPDGTYRPENTVSRAQMAVFIYLDLCEKAGLLFGDDASWTV